MADVVSLVKNETVPLVKPDGSGISKVRVGLSWDLSRMGGAADLDLFITKKVAGGKTTAYFGNKTAITGVQLSDDNRTGAGDGDDEFANFDASVTEDGEYFVCLDIFQAESRNQSFQMVSNAKVTVYNAETNEALVTYPLSADGGSHTGVVVGVLKDVGNSYLFTAKGDYVNGDINTISAAV